MSKTRLNKRLNSACKLGVCLSEDASKYADELKQLADQTANKRSAKTQSRFFKALADETRIRILGLLEVREMCVCEIMAALDLTQPTASHHLGLLKNAGLISDRKRGKWVFYSLISPEIVKMILEMNPSKE
jgi:ArsR family transcriptional regulator